ncbi:MAG: hypothetical protein LBD82_03965 [Deltaproteobacteria bacterium]|nr:hypothetical protein [Deltaproteobacteria bacterium]
MKNVDGGYSLIRRRAGFYDGVETRAAEPHGPRRFDGTMNNVKPGCGAEAPGSQYARKWIHDYKN